MRSPASFLILPVPIGPRFGPPPIIPQLRPLGEATPPSSPAASYWPTTTPWLCHLLEATPPSRLCPFLLARPPLLAVPPVAPPLSLAHSPAHLCFQPFLLAHSSTCPAPAILPLLAPPHLWLHTFRMAQPNRGPAHFQAPPPFIGPAPTLSLPFHWPHPLSMSRPYFRLHPFQLAPTPNQAPPPFPTLSLPIGPSAIHVSPSFLVPLLPIGAPPIQAPPPALTPPLLLPPPPLLPIGPPHI